MRRILITAAAGLALVASRAPAQSAAADSAAADSVPTVEFEQMNPKPRLRNWPHVRMVMGNEMRRVIRGPDQQWRVDVGVIIEPDGTPSTLVVARSSGNAAVDSAALAVMRASRYTPPRQDGHPVRVRGILPVTFESQPSAADARPYPR
ncbi:MAG TPA: energy transducer TonB [Longimicrobium sp.]